MGTDSPSFVVALGASGGGLAALTRFFKSMSPASGCAFVVAHYPHQAAVGTLAPLLRRISSMPVQEPQRTQPWQANTIYLASDAYLLEASRDVLSVQDEGFLCAATMPVDRLFLSVARHWAERGIAVVLSGHGSDGSAGAEIVAGAGGLVLTQLPHTADCPAMPAAVQATGCMHSLHTPAGLAKTVLNYVSGCEADTAIASADCAQLRQLQALQRRIAWLQTNQNQQAEHTSLTNGEWRSNDESSLEAQRIAATTFESQDAMIVMDAAGGVLRTNQAFVALFGYDPAEMAGQQPEFVYADIHDEGWRRDMRESLERDAFWRGEVLCRRKDDSVFPCWHRITSVRGDDNKVTHFVGAFTDITERKQNEVQIHQLAFFDPLTQLANRRLVLDRLAQRLLETQRRKSYGALLYLDLDHFKVLNDNLGHAMGDQLLVQVAHRLQSNVRGADTVGRLGGDEFLVVINELSTSTSEAATQAQNIAQKLLDALRAPFDLSGQEIETGTSIGICLFSGQEASVDTLLKQSDLALYQAKQAGRDQIRFYNPVVQAAADARASLDYSLRRAIERDQMVLLYQAQVDRSGRITGAEALIRWRHAERGLLLPAEFIAHAEDSGLILPLSQWVLRTACQQLAVWSNMSRARGLRLSINVSARQFRQDDFVASIRQTLRETGASPKLLALELTESVLLDNPEQAIDRMQQIRDLGVGISIDDFGTGYSSLSYLKRLPVDELKIDQSFVRDIAVDSDDAAIVKAIIDMGRSLKLKVYAEGVETSAQYNFLQHNGCDAFQGFLFGKPVAGTGELLASELA